MNLVEFLQDLSLRGIELWAEGDRLRYRAPKEALNENAPQNGLPSTVLAQLKAHKSEILRLLQVSPDAHKAYPLSYGQRALWFLHQLDPESAVYNIAFAARIRSTVNVDHLRQAFQHLAERHPLLRSAFPERAGEPVRILPDQKGIDFAVIDTSATSADEINRQVAAAYQQPFALEEGPVMRLRLFTTSAQDHILLWVMHHIISDGWSIRVLLDELRIVYPALQQGVPANLTPLKQTYQDYVRRQSTRLTGPQGEEDWAYWQQQLAGPLPALDLPTDKPRPPVQTHNGASHAFTIPADLAHQVRALAQREGVTLYMLLLAAFQVLLHRYSGQDDILVGSPSAGRSQPEYTPLAGYFVNPLVWRGDLSGEPTFKAFLARVRQTVLDGMAHQDFPFPLLVEKLQPQRDPSRSPIFQTSFIFQPRRQSDELSALSAVDETAADAPPKTVNWGGLELAPFALNQLEGQFELELELFDLATALSGRFIYNADLFTPPTIERLIGHFQALLSAIVTDPEQQISKLNLLPELERQQVLVTWNRSQIDYPSGDQCLHTLVEAQVERTPEAVAVLFDGQSSDSLTWRELNERANQLAHYLQSLGVGPDCMVGLCVDRSLEMVVAVLAILKAGGAYVPLDPDYPQDRLAMMLEDIQTPVLLTQSQLLDRVPYQGQSICLDTAWPTLASRPITNPTSGAGPDNLAYVIYTSGSTGRPKGVMNTHRAIGNRILWMQHRYPITAKDRVLQKTIFSFDASIWEIFLPLMVGAQLVVARPGGHKDSQYLIRTMIKHSITILQGVPSMYRMLVEEPEFKACADLRRVFSAGEALPMTLAQRIVSLANVELINTYGPTEASIDVSYWHVRPDDRYQIAPIGRPIGNIQLYILDKNLQPTPFGVPGELYAGGVGLAKGYLNRPELTQERFIPNPFSDDPQSRLYKTGDLVRYLPQDTAEPQLSPKIEFLGRLDHQVKVRGFRIELGEIEAVLVEHAQVRACVMVVREDTPGDQRLVAYVVPDGASDFDAAQPMIAALQTHLQQKLPDHMIPAAFVMMDALPLTPNGKVNRQALPAPTSDVGRAADYLAPATEIEAQVAAIWGELLDLEQVGSRDNFFDLGGHSLLATRMMARIRQTFDLEISLQTLFDAPVLAAFSQRIAQSQIQAAGSADSTIPLRPVDRNQPLPLTYVQEQLWFLDQLEGESATYNMAGAVRLTGHLDESALAQSLHAVVARHESLRTTFKRVDGRPMQIIGESQVQLMRVDLTDTDADSGQAEVERLIAAEARHPFDLTAGPLVRAGLIRLAEDAHILLVNIHHIISDGWSIGVLIDELAAHYTAFVNGEAPQLPALSIQYADFAHWQRQWLAGDVMARQLAYWENQLAGIPPTLDLVTDWPRPAVQQFQGAHYPFRLPKALSDQVKQLSLEEEVTLFMTLLASFNVMLMRYSGQSDIVVGSPIANRTRLELEPLIGLFVNILVLRSDLSGNPSFRTLLKRVQQMALAAYQHQDVPFEKLVEHFRPERNLSYSPLFQVMFIMQDTPLTSIELPDLTLEPLPSENYTAKYDLTLAMWETAEGLAGEWEYDTALFSEETIATMAGQFEVLLSGIVADADQSLASLPMMTAEEQAQAMDSLTADLEVY